MHARCTSLLLTSTHISSDLRYSLILSFIALLTFFVTSDNKKHWAVWWAWELGDDGVRELMTSSLVSGRQWRDAQSRKVEAKLTFMHSFYLWLLFIALVDQE